MNSRKRKKCVKIEREKTNHLTNIVQRNPSTILTKISGEVAIVRMCKILNRIGSIGDCNTRIQVNCSSVGKLENSAHNVERHDDEAETKRMMSDRK